MTYSGPILGLLLVTDSSSIVCQITNTACQLVLHQAFVDKSTKTENKSLLFVEDQYNRQTITAGETLQANRILSYGFQRMVL